MNLSITNTHKTLFGTDGVRGPTGLFPLTSLDSMLWGESVAQFCHQQNLKQRSIVLIGRDTRASGELLVQGLSFGLMRRGFNVIDCGVLPTPALAWLTKIHEADVGIMLSASHNHAVDNGLKIFNTNGLKLNIEQENNLSQVFQHIRQNLKPDHTDISAWGRMNAHPEWHTMYLEYLKNIIKHKRLSGLKIVCEIFFEGNKRGIIY